MGVRSPLATSKTPGDSGAECRKLGGRICGLHEGSRVSETPAIRHTNVFSHVILTESSSMSSRSCATTGRKTRRTRLSGSGRPRISSESWRPSNWNLRRDVGLMSRPGRNLCRRSPRRPGTSSPARAIRRHPPLRGLLALSGGIISIGQERFLEKSWTF